MADNTSWFSRFLRGASSAEEPAVAAMQGRISAGVSSRIEANGHLDEIVHEAVLSGQRTWTLSISKQTVALGWWLSLVYWQCAYSYLEGATTAADQPPSTQVRQACEGLCQQAEDWTVKAIGNQSRAEIDPHEPEMMGLQKFPKLLVTDETCTGVWAVVEALYLQVQTDLDRILASQVPSRFRPAMQVLQQRVQPDLALFSHYQRNWNESFVPSTRVDIARRALTSVQTFFEAGQQLWAPYLLGQPYAACMRTTPGLEDLELGFDPWVLSSRSAQATHKGSPANQAELFSFWSRLPNPGAVYGLQKQLNTALTQRRIRRTDRSYPTVPWPDQYLVRYPVTFGPRTFAPGDLIALYVNDGGQATTVEVRRTGRVTSRRDLLGQ